MNLTVWRVFLQGVGVQVVNAESSFIGCNFDKSIHGVFYSHFSGFKFQGCRFSRFLDCSVVLDSLKLSCLVFDQYKEYAFTQSEISDCVFANFSSSAISSCVYINSLSHSIVISRSGFFNVKTTHSGSTNHASCVYSTKANFIHMSYVCFDRVSSNCAASYGIDSTNGGINSCEINYTLEINLGKLASQPLSSFYGGRERISFIYNNQSSSNIQARGGFYPLTNPNGSFPVQFCTIHNVKSASLIYVWKADEFYYFSDFNIVNSSTTSYFFHINQGSSSHAFIRTNFDISIVNYVYSGLGICYFYDCKFKDQYMSSKFLKCQLDSSCTYGINEFPDTIPRVKTQLCWNLGYFQTNFREIRLSSMAISIIFFILQ